MKLKETISIATKDDQESVACPICGQIMKKEGVMLKNSCSHVLGWKTVGRKITTIYLKVEVETFYPKWFAKELDSLGIFLNPLSVAEALKTLPLTLEWTKIWGYLFPGILFYKNKKYVGGLLDYYDKSYYFDPETIREGAIEQMKGNRRWSKRNWVKFLQSRKH